MLNALRSIVEVFNSLLAFILAFIGGLIKLISDLPMYVSLLSSFLRFIPSYFTPFVTLFLTGSILFLILGRNRGGSS